MNLYDWWLDWCFRRDTLPFATRLAAEANLTTQLVGRMRGKHYRLTIHADRLDEIRSLYRARTGT